MRITGFFLATLIAGVLLAACGRDLPTTETPDPGGFGDCIVPLEEIADGGVGRDGIPSVQSPPLVAPSDPDADYLKPTDRVLGLLPPEGPVAVPLNILYFHEVVNLELGDRRLAVTYCPLTGSGLVFDRGPMSGAELGVSGLLFRNNLIVFDRRGDESSLWSQMGRQALCGPSAGTRMTPSPVIEATWEGWQALRPDTRVVSRRTGFGGSYDFNPYADYMRVDNPDLLVPMSIDERRPPKERVLGIPRGGDGGVAYPFGELSRAERRVIPGIRAGRPLVVLWSRVHGAAAAFYTDLDGETVTLEVAENGFRDAATGSLWRVDGRAVEGELEGRALEAVPDAYVAFWFAWAAFQPETLVWSP